MQRYGMVIGVKRDKRDEYRRLHGEVWPNVLARIADCHIENYSIFLRDDLLFSYFEYTGEDFAAEMARMAADPVTQDWWKLTDPCQEPLPGRRGGEWWASMDEVFHVD